MIGGVPWSSLIFQDAIASYLAIISAIIDIRLAAISYKPSLSIL